MIWTLAPGGADGGPFQYVNRSGFATGRIQMSMQISDNVVALFADLGVDASEANEPADVVIDRFDQWGNDCQGSMGLSSICGIAPVEEYHAA
jgi:hypothetical protein